MFEILGNLLYTAEVIICNLGRYLMLSILSKNFNRQHFEIFFLFFPENRLQHFMQIVSLGDNLHEILRPIFCEKPEKKSICHLLNLPREW